VRFAMLMATVVAEQRPWRRTNRHSVVKHSDRVGHHDDLGITAGDVATAADANLIFAGRERRGAKISLRIRLCRTARCTGLDILRNDGDVGNIDESGREGVPARLPISEHKGSYVAMYRRTGRRNLGRHKRHPASICLYPYQRSHRQENCPPGHYSRRQHYCRWWACILARCLWNCAHQRRGDKWHRWQRFWPYYHESIASRI